jgi:hypothetical protein
MVKYTDEQVMKALKDEVRERGEDYVDPGGCEYWNGSWRESAPACIVGAALYRLGESEEFLREADTITTVSTSPDGEYFSHLYSKRMGKILRRAQKLQDVGSTWGEVLDEAQKHFATLD